MAYTKYSVLVSDVERMAIEIDMVDPATPIIADGEMTPIQIGGNGPREAAEIANDWYKNDCGYEAWGEDEEIEVVEE